MPNSFKHWAVLILTFGLVCFAGMFHVEYVGASAPAAPAFPGIMGGGAASIGGRGGQIIDVTNLNDSGAGSLRACVQASGPRSCNFRLGGVIVPKSRLSVNNPYLTVPCQTAPGGGIVVGGPGNSGEVFQVATHDVIISFCTWDGNNGTTPGPDDGSVGMEGGNGNAYNVVFSNNTSYRWGNKGNFTISNDSGNASRMSFYRNFIFTPNAGHPVVAEPDNFGGGSANATYNIDYIQNLIAFYDHRCILFNIGSTSMVNNVCFDGLQNSSSFNTNFWNGLKARFEGNLYIDGPNSSNKVRDIIGQAPETGNDASDCYPNCDNWHVAPQLMLKDNVGHANDDTGGTPIPVTHVVNDAGQKSLTYQGWEGGQDPKNGIVIAPMPSSWFVPTDPTQKVQYPIVALANPLSFDTDVAPVVGNFQGLTCTGGWFARRNSLDAAALSAYLAKKSFPMFTVGQGMPTPTIAGGTPCDQDPANHLPTAFEAANKIPAGTPSNQPDATGYTLWDKYIWSISGVVPPPQPPVVSCTPSSVAPGGNSACAANQAITNWSTSAGAITPAGALTAPMTPSTVTVSGSNTNGTGNAPVVVAVPGAWSGWLGADALPGAAIGKQVVIGPTAGQVRSAGCGSANPISPQPTNYIGTTVTVIGGPASCNGGIQFWQVQSGSTPPPVHPTVSCAPTSVPTSGTSTCTSNQQVTWSASAGTITAAGIFTAPSTAQAVTITGTNANGSGATPITVTAAPPPNVWPTVTLAAPGIKTTTCTFSSSANAYVCAAQ